MYLSNGGLQAVLAWLGYRGEDPGPLVHPVRKGGTILRRRMDDQSVLDLCEAARAQGGGRPVLAARFSPVGGRRFCWTPGWTSRRRRRLPATRAR